MNAINITPLGLAQRFVGIRETVGPDSNPQILAMLRLDDEWPKTDATPWCSAFVNYIAWLLNLPRSRRLNARSWLAVGQPVPLDQARPGFDVAVLTRGKPPQPGPEKLDAPGHVGFFAGFAGINRSKILVLGGNQGDTVSIAEYPAERLLGVRRLA